MTGLARPAALDILQRAAFDAGAAEKTLRARFAVEVERVEAARRHAFRRYAFLKALVDADACALDLEASRAAQRAAAAAELDWDEIDAARRPVLDALAPLVDAVHAARITAAEKGAALHLSPAGRGRPEGPGEGASPSPNDPEAPSPAGLRPATSPRWEEVKTGDRPADNEQAAPLLAALAAFEAWHLAERGKPFEALFDTYVPETPRVDF